MVKDSFILDYDTNGLKTFACEFVGSTNLAAGRKIGTPGSQTPMTTERTLLQKKRKTFLSGVFEGLVATAYLTAAL